MVRKAGKEMSKDRVALVGVGNVGATTAYALLLSGLAPEIVLINRDRNKAEGEAEDISHAEPWSHTTLVRTGGFEDCAERDGDCGYRGCRAEAWGNAPRPA